MSESKRCPSCGAPQQCATWRLCACGYDYGPGDAALRQPESQDAWAPDEDLVGAPLRRSMRWLSLAAGIVFLITREIPAWDWLSSASCFVLLPVLWSPDLLFRPRKRSKAN